MSTNCLITKLKGTVDNNSLCRLGFMRIKVDDITKYASFSFGSGNLVEPYTKMYLEGDAVFTDTGTNEHNIETQNIAMYPSGPFVLQVPKYYMSIFSASLTSADVTTLADAINIEELQFTDRCRGLTITFNNGVYGDLSKLSNLVLGRGNGSPELNLYRTSVTGTLLNILAMYDPDVFTEKSLTLNVGGTAITGNLKTLFDTWATVAGSSRVCSLFFGANNPNIIISDLEPTPGVSVPVRCRATAAGDGTYTYEFS